ncbi:PREDICTED: phosphoserine phosphatase isoform X2 [Trachymyrmex cornetzi]|uniref:phosphoserine phosphatase isoform X2 n=1 Tax=Trachymyrmex cornetzi TaxID=471704 RepID=UPI00084ED53F|nr:PREDICTED: phosphoserine phosphatase isoform X2 [Trachymyrmex cornetzi]
MVDRVINLPRSFHFLLPLQYCGGTQFVRRCRPLCLPWPANFAGVDKMSPNQIRDIWRTADAVTFDVDSTVITEEAIDELASFCGKGKQITELTKQAMQGDMTFQQSLSIRLGIINPSMTQVKEFLNTHQPSLTTGIKKLVSTLQARGEYAGFDETQPTSRSGGKGEVIRRLKEEKGFKIVVHVGDGSTDLEASPPADAFIGFGGNVIRENVKSRAQWFVTNFDDLVKCL